MIIIKTLKGKSIMKKEWLKQLMVQLGVQSIFVAADQAVRTVVSAKVKPMIGRDEDHSSKK
jgi:hypothetical protein